MSRLLVHGRREVEARSPPAGISSPERGKSFDVFFEIASERERAIVKRLRQIGEVLRHVHLHDLRTVRTQ